MNVVVALLIPVAYLVGTFPSAHLIARRRGVDVTAVGSGNPGASNVGRLLGRRAGIAVFALDAAKGALPAWIGVLIGGPGGGLALGASALIGHVYPITRGGRGGKGVATAGGASVAVYPLLAVLAMGSWPILAKITRRASVASLIATSIVPIGVVVMDRPRTEAIVVIAMVALIVVRHRANLSRLVKGEEMALRSEPPRQ